MRVNDPRKRRSATEPLEGRYCLSAISFAPQPIDGYALAGSPAMITSDLDGDGDLDFVSGRIGWRANLDGLGTFGVSRIVSTQTEGVDALFAGDVDGDGDYDIVSSSPAHLDGELAWYENRDGKGTFGPKQVLADIYGHTRSLIGADLDADGDLDLIHAVSGTSDAAQPHLTWYENTDGQGTYVPRTVDSAESSWTTAIDLDRDGDLDLVAGTAWYENSDGKGTFVKRTALVDGTAPHSAFVLDDVDNNNRLDLVVERAWYEATENPTVFALRQMFDTNPAAVGPSDTFGGDVDGDGRLEIFVVDPIAAEFSEVNWFLLADGAFVEQESIGTVSPSGGGIVLSDVNGDQRDDLLIYSGDSGGNDELIPTTTWTSYQAETGSFGPKLPLDEPFDPTTDLTMTDIDGDGDLDIVTASWDGSCNGAFAGRGCYQSLSWSENLNDSDAFGPRSTIIREKTFDEEHFSKVWAWDVDNDLDMDLLVLGPGRLVWFENSDGRGAIGREKPVFDRGAFSTVIVDDIDQDGRVDVLNTSFNDHSVYRSTFDDAEQRFQTVPIAAGWNELRVSSMTSGDIDRDGDVDVVVSGSLNGARVTAWYEFLADQNSFGFAREILPQDESDALQPSLQSTADMDEDGDVDLIALVERDGQSDLVWIENDGAGQFGELHDIAAGEFVSQVTPMDLDQDGDIDLASRRRNAIVWYENKMSGSAFRPPQRIADDIVFAIGDLDHDGDADLVTSTTGLTWHEQRAFGDVNGDGRFDSSDLVLVLQAGRYEDDVPHNASFFEGDWDGDGDFTTSDLVVAFQLGTYVAEARPVS